MKKQTLTLALILGSIASCNRTKVALSGAYSYASAASKRETTERSLLNDGISKSDKILLRNIHMVKAYLEENGLTVKGRYNYFTNSKSNTTWVVTATPKFKLSYNYWWFPIVGNVPYLGFTQKDAAEEFANTLANKGLEYSIRPAVAYSTLGWFNDPITPEILKEKLIGSTTVIIHELIHTFIWGKNDAQFNESVAHIVSLNETLRYFNSGYSQSDYLSKDFSENSKATSNTDFIKLRINEELIKSDTFDTLVSKLEKLYADDKFSSLSLEIKNKRKQELFNQAAESLSLKLNNKVVSLPANNAKLLENYIYLQNLRKINNFYRQELESNGGNIGKAIKMLYKNRSVLNSIDHEQIDPPKERTL